MNAFGPYRVVRELGRGGMGRVYEVAHPEMPGRRLALKLAPVPNERSARRFAREVELLGRVRHPGVVAVHASGIAPEGPWLVMDLIEGKTLAETLRERGAFPLERAGAMGLALAEAVAALHAAGILHRDLKPENVMLRADGSPVLVDFGLARAEDSERLTRTGAVIGTPGYLAPELLAPAPARPDPRVDVWGVGTILYALLVGQAPFEEGSSFADTVRRITEEDPRWPAAPAPLLAVLRRALAKRPEDRQPDAGVLAGELGRALRGEAPAGAPSRPRGLAVAAGLATLLALGALATRALRPPAPEPVAPPPAPEPTPIASVAPSVPAAPTAPPRWQRLEHPGQPERAAGAFTKDGSGRFLTWAAADLTPGRSELVEWRLGPAGAAPTGRRWDLEREVAHLELAGARALLVVGRSVLLLDLDAQAARPLPLLPAVEERITAMGLQADGRRFALAVGERNSWRASLLAYALEGDQAVRVGKAREVQGVNMVTAVLVEPEGMVASMFGSVGVNGLVVFPDEGPSSRVPTTTAPLFVTRDPLGGLWLGTDGLFLHRCDPTTGLVEPQLEGVGARSNFEAGEGEMMRASSHNGAPLAFRFVRAPRLGFSISNDILDGIETPVLGSPERGRELRVWAEANGEWKNVGGVAGFPAPLRSLDVAPDGSWILLGHGGALELWAREAIPPLAPGDRAIPAHERVVAALRRS